MEHVGLDTEFHGERFYSPRLMIVQIALGDDVAIVDAVALKDLRPLAAALSDVVVTGHALQSDLKIFADRFERLPRQAFDTQLAAAFCGFGMSISLADLVAREIGVRLRKAHTVSDWATRPLSEAQLTYLVDDVAHLEQLRHRLSENLAELDRTSWFLEESAPLVDPAEYAGDPERLYMRIAGANRMNRRELGILRELAQLRDGLARERDVPPKFIIPDDAMGSLVHLRPQSVADLASLRRLDGGMRKAFGERIVEAVARGLALPEERLPRRPSRTGGADREAIASLLAVVVQQLATELRLPAALLAPRSALERIARELPADVDSLAALLSPDEDSSRPHWRANVVAQPLFSLLSGHAALSIEGAAQGAPRIDRRSLS